MIYVNRIPDPEMGQTPICGGLKSGIEIAILSF
jgi:hypothetical protein